MGFFNNLFGGSKNTSTSSSASGYSTVPESMRLGFDKLGQAASQYTNPNDPANLARFTPIGETADETAAYNALRGGFAPTADSLKSDIGMLMNPYMDSVIGGINNQANSNYSILKQALNEAGQFGSNRQMLGANDIELQRQNMIGSLMGNQYNKALDTVFNNLIPQRQQDATNLLGIGDRQRILDMQTKLAPIEALKTGTSMISPFTSSSSNSFSSGNTTNGILSAFSGGGGTPIGNFASSIGNVASRIGNAISPYFR